MDAVASDEARDRSSSNTSGSSKSQNGRATRTSTTVRRKHRRAAPASPASSTAARQPQLPDDNSLTSFPSLSPSLASSPVGTTRHVPKTRGGRDDTGDGLRSGRPSSTALEDLFSPASDHGDRLALFEDSAPVRDVPGAMHHIKDSHVEHMIARVGAVPLVKQMAQDLAQRDAQVTQIQRRAQERERLLRKMLRECEVSNLDIETRLKELETERAKESRKVSGKSIASEQSSTSIDEQMEEAFEDILGGHTVANGAAEISRNNSAPSGAMSMLIGSASRLPPAEEKTVKKQPSTSRGWRGLFGGGGTAKAKPDRGAPPRSDSAQERLSQIHTASQISQQRKSLSHDLFRPPPRAEDDSSVATASDNERESASLRKTDSNDSRSNSVASWAYRLVGGGAQTDQQREASREGVTASNQQRTRPQSTIAKQAGLDGTKPRHQKSRTISTSVGPNGTLKRPTLDNRAPMSAIMASSPPQAPTSSLDDQGPTEMDTILPDETRPPTLAQYENLTESAGILTDRFGFIYDQKRRVRQGTKASSRSDHRIETLANHRKTQSIAASDDDAASISSQLSLERAVSPPPNTKLADPNAKRWQDYLKLSSLPGGELLSHTPAAAPITDIVTGAGPGDTPKKSLPKLSISHKGLDLNMKTDPSLSSVVSENAQSEIAAPPLETSTTTANDEQDSVKSLLEQLTEVHDSLQREKASRWNDFLKKIRTERARGGETGTATDRRSKRSGVPEASWTDGEMIGIAGLGNEGKVGRAKWIEFKNLVLGGIPVSYRAKVWAECSGASALRMPGYYDELVANTSIDDVDVVNQIRMDIPRTLTDNIFFRKGQGMQKLEEILMAYARRNPEVGYCQGMNMITANLLLIMPTAEDAFWVLVALVEHILPDKYYDSSLLASRADQTVLRHYVGSILPQLSTHLENLSIELEALTFQWFLSIFTDCLSAEALFRVWDVVLCTQDGATFLFQVAMALLKLNERSLLACKTPSQIYTYINSQMTDHAVSIDGLVKASDGLKKVVKREDVMKRRSVVIAQELEAAREREALRKGKGRAIVLPPSPPAEAAEAATAKVEEAPARRASAVDLVDDEDRFTGELEYRSPMPVDEEVEWRA